MRLSFGGVVLYASLLSAAEWSAPADGKFTEKQLENYIGAQREIFQYFKAAGKAMEGSKGLGAISVAAGINDKIKAIYDKNGLQQGEYEWIGGKVGELLGVVIIDDIAEKSKAELIEQKKKNSAEIAAVKAKIAAFETASKSGTRVLTPERREELVKQYKDQETAALEEAKTRTDEAKSAADEAAKAEADAKASDALAAKPPADVDADSKPEYIKGKKEEAQNFRTAAKEVRDKEKEARKLEAESKAKAAGFAKQAAHPEVPTTDEEKEQVKNDNAQGLEAAKGELETLTQATQILADADTAAKKQTEEYHKAIKEENLALVKKHHKEILKAMGVDEKK